MRDVIAIGSDHGGYSLKIQLIKALEKEGYAFEDYGTYDQESCHYPVYAQKVAEAIRSGKHQRGILVCGTGIGMSMAANKVPGIRAAAVTETFGARYTRLHNNANILCLGERITGPGAAVEIAKVFLETEFEGGRHQTRIDMITNIENTKY